MKVLELTLNKTPEQSPATIEIHMLQPGEHFPKFGGSSRGLTARKTASLITRTKAFGTWSDVEYDIADKSFWMWLAERINNADHLSQTAYADFNRLDMGRSTGQVDCG